MLRIPLLLTLALIPACATPPPPHSGPVPDRPGPVNGPPSDGSFAAPRGDLRLVDAHRAALLGSPELAASRASLRAGEARALQAALLPNPELEIEMEEFGGDRSGFGDSELSLALTQEILVGGDLGARSEAARFGAEVVALEVEEARLDLLEETTRRFVRLLRAQGAVVLHEKATRTSREVAESVAALAEAGKVADLEADRAAVEYSRERLRLRRARQELELARRALAQTWGASVPSFDRAVGDLSALRPVPGREALARHLAKTPALLRRAVEVRMAKAERELAGAEAWPDLAVTGGFRRFGETDEHTFFAGIALPLPLFDTNPGGRREAAASVERARALERAAVARLDRELHAAWIELISLGEELRVLDAEVLPLARRTFEAAKESFAEGKAGTLAVLDAQRTLFEVEEQLLTDRAAWHDAAAVLERLIGRSLGSLKE